MAKNTTSILIFACEWIPYTAADNAGMGSIQYPTGTGIIKVNCSGRITPAQIIKSFRQGARGVLIAGCMDGECHYVNGNGECKKVVDETKQLLEMLGITPERLKLELFSEMDGANFAKVVGDFVQEIEQVTQ